jgi:hypothetical protein
LGQFENLPLLSEIKPPLENAVLRFSWSRSAGRCSSLQNLVYSGSWALAQFPEPRFQNWTEIRSFDTRWTKWSCYYFIANFPIDPWRDDWRTSQAVQGQWFCLAVLLSFLSSRGVESGLPSTSPVSTGGGLFEI